MDRAEARRAGKSKDEGMGQTSVIVGLTGQTGAGKSIVSNLLVNRGYKVLDADLVARQVVMKGSKCLVDLALEFGIEILESDGTLNRRKLGSIVFADKAKRKKLNQIIFPYIKEEIMDQLRELCNAGVPVIFLDAPTLFESGTNAYCDKVVSVMAPRELRKQRIIARDGLSELDADNRINSQLSDEYYTSHSDYIIDNSGDLSALRVGVLEMLDFLGIGRNGVV